MRSNTHFDCVSKLSISTVLVMFSASGLAADEIRFGRDVLPILSANCFACHGPDEHERKGNLRLDIESDAKTPHDSGIPVVPGKPDESTIMLRIMSNDPEQVMPPADSHKTLRPEQKQILKAWIEQGGAWGKHWSFEPIAPPSVTVMPGESPIDVIVEGKLRDKGLHLRSREEAHRLVRRIWLDTIGLPPSYEVAARFAAEPTDAALSAMIDDLLARPEFGEHWARMWMDLARYADTKGYEKDLGRTMWPYRDWLVRSLNNDMSLEQMTIEQLAGDLLPNPTQDQLIATAFHRNTMSNDEGGTDDEEFRTIAVKDRVDTTVQVWMGLTAGCAKCHSHKYDPISQSEYYGLYAAFNQTEDADRYDDSPTLELSSEGLDRERAAAKDRINVLKQQLADAEAADAGSEKQPWQPLKAKTLKTSGEAKLVASEAGVIDAEGTASHEDVYELTMVIPAGTHTMLRLDALMGKLSDGNFGVGRNPRDPNFVLSELEVELIEGDTSKKLTLTNPKADFQQNGWPVTAALDGDTKTGWAISPRQREKHAALFEFAEPLVLPAEAVLKIVLRQHYGDSLVLRRFRLSTIGLKPSDVTLPENSAEVRRLTDELAAANKQLQDIASRTPKLPVMKSVKADHHRTTKIHRRGNFLDPGDEVSASLPAAFRFADSSAANDASSTSVDRLAVAHWLMHRDNTLTSRVWANRIWARLFGLGLVETEEDFGALGALPANPELLDWLAAEYRDNGWSLKKLLKTIVMSRTYQQSSVTNADLRSVDPRNVLLSRGSRYRLSAEAIRDSALAASGLLSLKKGGPPVMPPQPDGLWRSTYNGLKWVNAEGEDRYRRALYTYLKRTTPYPSMLTFDGGSGEVCQIRRIRTNTPLQALVTLNDPVFLEAAAALAAKIAAQPGTVEDRAEFGMQTVLVRHVEPSEVTPLVSLYNDVLQDMKANPSDAKKFVESTRGRKPESLTEEEFAAWIIVANATMNLDEFLTRN
ncbi:MAG: PSD1 domain-containing protein [Planctomycetaceae bacterium]|nr:PSD1 domain-containing protein [Planctomycetaceae bacterium]